MKRFFSQIAVIFTCGMFLTTVYSCSSDSGESFAEKTVEPSPEIHVCEINFNASLAGYDGQVKSNSSTRAENAETWKDGDKVYLRFTSPIGITTGEAVYNASKSNWMLSYYGSLYEDAANSCTAVYIENAEKAEANVILLNQHSIIYEDNTGSYIVEDGNLTVTANLKPKLGRLRFKGTAGKVMKVYDISHYTFYDASTHLYTDTNAAFESTVNSDGYTDYIYGYFTNETYPSVKLWIDKKEAYTRFFTSNVMVAGESGVMTIPTETSHSSWTWGLTFNIDGKTMTMIPVEGGTFAMGNEAEENSKPVHNVTLDSYCIGETEVTDEFYCKATGSTSAGSTIPRTMVKSSWQSFANTFSSLTGGRFFLPTEAQWEYAARGGKKSKGYMYSGSNNIDDVAWYNNNSDKKYHPAKQKLPNELGLYDMSGNALEIVRDYWFTYTNSSEINPIGASSSSYGIARGGRYDYGVSQLTTTCRSSWSNNSSNTIGGRMVIEW